jgi:uncharacterized membrane protein
MLHLFITVLLWFSAIGCGLMAGVYFAFSFFIMTSLASVGLAILGVLNWGQPGAVFTVAGAVIYFVGMFVVTLAFNVPLNNALAEVDPLSASATSVWNRYLSEWTFWNHVRTAASAAASGLFILALTRLEL